MSWRALGIVALTGLAFAGPAQAADPACALTAKQVVERFSQLFFIEKKPVEAYMNYVAPDYVQHNPIATDGRDAAIKALGPIFAANPDLKVDIKRIVGDAVHVAVHYHSVMKPGTPGFAAVDLFRVKDCRIVEHWDVIQPMPTQSANDHPMF
jgi:predicted SnoaL-like aldol condensation-catalyzing enzyme